MNKDYLIYKLADRVKAASRIDSSLFPQYGVKRGLRNEDGSGVLVGLTNVGNVVGYRREEDGSLTRQDFFELARVAGSAYGNLANSYEVFRGPQVPVKALLLWGEPLLYSGHTGIFWAPTGESGVPLNCPDADLPFIMCHEAAHRLGIADEGEANFAAFLACDDSADARLVYSGYFNAFSYCFGALYGADPDRAVAMVNETAEGALGQGVYLLFADRAAARELYDSYKGPFQEVGTAVNDTYLKSFGESEGVRSYGLVVDSLIAWHEAMA